MSDVIYFKPADFFAHKHVQIEDAILKKYKAFFEQYNCFSEQAVVLIQNTPAPKHAKKYPSTIKRENKTIKRTILGILNVINADNYKKMLVKTKILINTENITEIFTEILNKCVYQIFYFSVYFMFIQDLLNSLSDNERNTAKAIIRKFVEDFIDDGYIIEQTKTEDAYHDFCMLQKNKLAILSKNQMTIQFVNHMDFLQDINLQEFSNKIFNILVDTISVNNEYADVLLNLMLELKKYYTFDMSIFKNIKTTNKLQFLINDIAA